MYAQVWVKHVNIFTKNKRIINHYHRETQIQNKRLQNTVMYKLRETFTDLQTPTQIF